jgi:hypothetical protein
VTQSPGAQFKASNVAYQQGNNFSQLSLDISKAYKDSAAINSWQRSIRLNRGKNVELKDAISLKAANNITEHFMTTYPAEVTKPGELVIHYQPKNATAKDFVIRYNAKQMEARVDKVPLESMEDKGVKEKWGDNIYRISFNVIKPKAKDQVAFVVEALQ